MGHILCEEGDTAQSNYDTGDTWTHLLDGKKAYSEAESMSRAELREGALQCPPEDPRGARQSLCTCICLHSGVYYQQLATPQASTCTEVWKLYCRETQVHDGPATRLLSMWLFRSASVRAASKSPMCTFLAGAGHSVQWDHLVAGPMCTAADDPPTTHKCVQMCGGCRAVRYCSAVCQQQHWKDGAQAGVLGSARASAGGPRRGQGEQIKSCSQQKVL